MKGKEGEKETDSYTIPRDLFLSFLSSSPIHLLSITIYRSPSFSNSSSFLPDGEACQPARMPVRAIRSEGPNMQKKEDVRGGDLEPLSLCTLKLENEK